MRIIGDNFGWAGGGVLGREVFSMQEALRALSGGVARRLEWGLCHVWGYLHPDDAGIDDEDGDRERRTVFRVAKQRPGVLSEALRRSWPTWELGLAPFDGSNVPEWPLSVPELRRDPALAGATTAELAAHLNARLRGDVAVLLRDCGGFVRPDLHLVEVPEVVPETVSCRFRDESHWADVSWLEEGAVEAGGPQWEALDEWTPGGGVGGDPQTVCRFRLGREGARAQLTPAELLAAYLAGDVELALYRTVLDDGNGPTEFIWPEPRRCCGTDLRLSDPPRPVALQRELYIDREEPGFRERARRCDACGATHVGGVLIHRRLDPGEEAPLGTREPLDALPEATLDAIARDGVDGVAWDLCR